MSAARLRRSAIVERLRLREEWSALKGTDDSSNPTKISNNHKKTVTRPRNAKQNHNSYVLKSNTQTNDSARHLNRCTSNVLRGTVALVEVGSESRALPLRAALTALGATVVPKWSPLVTHLIWSQGGCRATRAKARALASQLVSPLWVEACAASNRKLPERPFPTATRESDLPSPRTLRQLLKKAEMENIPLANLLSDSQDGDGDGDPKTLRLRISSENDTTDKTTDTSRDTSHDKSGVKVRVNTAPRHALPEASARPRKSRRKLFTQREAEHMSNSTEDTDTDSVPAGRQQVKSIKLTQRERKELARAERMAKRLLLDCTSSTNKHTDKPSQSTVKYRFVLTGMSRAERVKIHNALRSFNGHVQKRVNKKTTHIILGSCVEEPINISFAGQRNISNTSFEAGNNGISRSHCSKDRCLANIDGNKEAVSATDNRVKNTCGIQKPRTLNALLGAARGCKVLNAQWVMDSVVAQRWLHHHGYEIPHLRKISQKARVERTALGRAQSEYAYDVFNGMRVRLSASAEQKDAVTELLTLCGAVVLNGGDTQNGGQGTADCDMTIGTGEGEVASKWVFDSVAAARMRTTRRYVNG